MIGRRSGRVKSEAEAEPRGFDAFDLRLGDVMRGERATMGKSLLDVERELRIRANYISAIEDSTPEVFDTPGFIPGYVRSYARYLNMDPDKAFRQFCAESGFSTAHGMAAEASSVRKPDAPSPQALPAQDPFSAPKMTFLPASESFLARIDPGAVGSFLVLGALIGGIGYGAFTVLNEVQRVTLAPVENTPDVLADLDPLAGMGIRNEDVIGAAGTGAALAREESLGRLYRPEALDVPVMVARDAPISTLDPARMGALSPDLPNEAQDSEMRRAVAQRAEDAVPAPGPAGQTPQVLAEPPSGVELVAVRAAWVRVRAADGSVVFEGILNAGDTWEVPVTEDPPTLRVGESGAVYFAVNGTHYGPAGPNGAVTSNLALDTQSLTDRFAEADLTQDQDLMRYVVELQDKQQGEAE